MSVLWQDRVLNINEGAQSRLGFPAQQHKIVCVVNDYVIFDKVVKTNEKLSNFDIIDYDNTTENIAITKRYNNFIDEIVGQRQDDFWMLFIHQDFGITDDIESIVEKLNKNCIWGAIGIKIYRGIFIGKKGIEQKIGLKQHRILTLGSISQGNNDFNFAPYGKEISSTAEVDSIDCCCIMIHSSLIKKYNLHFDENLTFHMYAEELCYRTKKEYKIKTKVVQLKCFHLGKGNLNEEYQNSVAYLKNKFKIKKIPSTCPN